MPTHSSPSLPLRHLVLELDRIRALVDVRIQELVAEGKVTGSVERATSTRCSQTRRRRRPRR